MTYFSGFAATNHTTLTSREFTDCDFEEIKPCRVESNTKTKSSGVLSQASIGLILVITQLF